MELVSGQDSLFESAEPPGQLKALDQEIFRLTINKEVYHSLKKSNNTTFTITTDLPGLQEANIQLTESKLLDKDFKIVSMTLDGPATVHFKKSRFYQGYIKGQKKSMVSLMFGENSIKGVLSWEGKNWNLTPDKILNKYLLISDHNKSPENFHLCDASQLQFSETSSFPQTIAKSSNSMLSNVDLYIECDYKMYTDFDSSIDSTVNFTLGLLNVVNTLYNGAGINLNLTELKVWTVLDPYDANAAKSAKGILNSFKCHLDGNYNGRLAHLISTVSKFGGIANLRINCPFNKPLYAFSGIYKYYSPDLNIFSWAVNVLAHEIGHNLSAHHTNACVWNGNNSQIDDCANVFKTENNDDSNCDGIIDNLAEAEGSDCFDVDNPILPNKGTIMSYCFIVSGGTVDLSQGFHPQVAARMKSFSDNCLSQTTTVYCPLPDPSLFDVNFPDPNKMQLSYSDTSDISEIRWNYKLKNGCGTTSKVIYGDSSPLIVDNIYASRLYEITCQFRCRSTNDWSDRSCAAYFNSPSCHPNTIESGLNTNKSKVIQVSEYILSDEQITDDSEFNYYYGSYAELYPGFEVELASTFSVSASFCQ